MSTTIDTENSWLIVIDMQNVFLDEGQPWYGKYGKGIINNIEGLIRKFGERTIFTKFVARDRADPVHRGSWADYFKLNSTADKPSDDPMWDITPELAKYVNDSNVVTMTTFNKWGDRSRGLRAKLSEDFPRLYLTGVSTECCVWSTAVAAGESGAFVTIFRDACAAPTPEAQAAVFELVHPSYEGLINLVPPLDENCGSL